jgi:hypothetical protein
VAYSAATSERAKHPALPRKNQPTGFSGRREAIKPPTIAFTVRARGKITAAATSDLLRTASATAQAIEASVSPKIGQASRPVAREGPLPTPRFCAPVSVVTTLLYRKILSRS